MATPMTAPPTYVFDDPSKGLELIDGKGEGVEVTRYVWLGLDALDPDRREQVTRLERGGEEVVSHCLRRSPNFVPRCTITPVEIWKEDMALEHVPDGTRSVEVRDPSVEVVPITVRGMLRGRPLRSVRTYPGEEMGGILSPVGIVELTSLHGIEWDSGEAQRIQHEFFPRDWPLPIELRLVEERIRERYNAHQGVAEDKLRSIARSRRWAQTRIQTEHALMDINRAGKGHEWTYTYTPLGRHLLAQLELNPRDQGWESMMAQSNAQLTTAIAQGMTQTNSTMSQAELIAAVTAAVVAAMSAGKTAEQVQDEVPKMFTCEHCGEEMKLTAKSFHIGIHCKVLHPKTDTPE